MKPLFRRGPSSTVRVLVLGACALGIGIAAKYTSWFDEIKQRSVDVIAPFYMVADLPAKIEGWAESRTMSRAKLVQENNALRSEVLVLRRKLQREASLSAENFRLRQLLNSSESITDRVLIAELIGLSPDPLIHKVMINRGSDDGVYQGQAVLDAFGLMGQVVDVAAHHAFVLLITDATHAIPVQITRNGARFVAEGTGNLFELNLRYVANTQDIKVGDLLVSSGLGQRFPIGYPVAEVMSVHIDPAKRFARVSAKPKAELNQSRHVLLVFDSPPVGE